MAGSLQWSLVVPGLDLKGFCIDFKALMGEHRPPCRSPCSGLSGALPLLKIPAPAAFRLALHLAVATSGIAALPALGALRTIPADAPATIMTVNVDGTVVLGKKVVALSPGAQIRDAENRIVVPASLTGTYRVRVQLNAEGQLNRAWILTGEEAAQPAPKF